MNSPNHIEAMAALRETLVAAVPDLHDGCRNSWVVIGSAAALLIGADVRVADIDVLTSVRDAEALSDRWQHRHDGTFEPSDAKRFRSCFARYAFPGLPLEIMGGLEVFVAGVWQSVRIDELEKIDAWGMTIPVPSLAEQIRVMNFFGRPKDYRRVAALHALDGVSQ